MEKLFPEFKGSTSAQWKEKIVKDLKGIDFKQLVWHTPNGFDVQPFYTSEDIKETKAPLFFHHDWDICEHITVDDEKRANERALKALEGGASGLSFFIHKKINTKALLDKISLEHIYTQFFISNDALHLLDDLKNYYGKTNAYDGKVKCFVNIDPLCMFVYYGEWHENSEKDLSVLKRLMHIPVNVSLYQEAGSTTVNELAFGLSHLNEYLHFLSENNSLKNKTLHCSFSIGSDFFTEIAKLRTFRKLAGLLLEQYGVSFPVHIHAQTSQLNKSALDRYTNMLRTTTEGMSAVIGGCNSLSVLPFNEGIDEVTDFGARIARNQQHIFKEESYLNKIADMANGSYYIETLTDELCAHAWEQFKYFESKGGFIKCIENNVIQDILEKDDAFFIESVKDGKTVLVGVNKFQNAKEELKSLPESKQSEIKGKIKAIRPVRLSESFEKEKLKNSEQTTLN